MHLSSGPCLLVRCNLGSVHMLMPCMPFTSACLPAVCSTVNRPALKAAVFAVSKSLAFIMCLSVSHVGMLQAVRAVTGEIDVYGKTQDRPEILLRALQRRRERKENVRGAWEDQRLTEVRQIRDGLGGCTCACFS